MHLTLRQLQIFIAVVQTGSTTAAALSVALSQSATSAALSELEAALAARLFDRVGKRLVLNDNGRALLPQARSVLDGARNIETEFASEGGGLGARLRLGASTTIGNYLLPALIAGYHKVLPGVGMDIAIGNTLDICSSVARLDSDLGLIEGPCREPDVQVHPWLEDELVIVCGRKHHLLREHPNARVTPRVLRTEQWLLREPGSGTREAVEQALIPHLHQLQSAMQLGSSEAIKQASALGLGLACLSRCVVQDLLAQGRLVELTTSLPRLTRRFYLIHHRQKQFSARLQHFFAHCLAA